MQSGQVVALGSVGKADWLVATISQYRFAPLTEDQLNVGVVEIPVAPLEGPPRDGAGRSVIAAVLKLRTLEYAPWVPSVFQAWTFQ
jgi:hypothetical protein